MTTATIAQIKQAFEDSPVAAQAIAGAMQFKVGKFDEERVKAWLANEKTNHLQHRLGKGYRPWDLINVTAKLDKTQPWIGVEYETGYKTNAAYQSVVNYLWQNHPFTAIDREGCGAYPCEITFSPVNMNDFMTPDYAMDKLIGWMNENDAKKPGHAGSMVGTHVNVSTPAYRNAEATQQRTVVRVLNTSAYNMKDSQHKALWGRSPYGYFYQQAPGPNGWIEGKMFDSVGDLAKWQAYKPTMARIATLIEMLAGMKFPAMRTDGKGKALEDYEYADVVKNYCMTNMAEFLLGKTDVPEFGYSKSKY